MSLDLLWQDSTLVAAGATVSSAYIKVDDFSALRASKKHVTGTYGFKIDWSADGVNSDIQKSYTVGDNDALDIPVVSKYAKVTVSCTTTTFTVHKTVLAGIMP